MVTTMRPTPMPEALLRAGDQTSDPRTWKATARLLAAAHPHTRHDFAMGFTAAVVAAYWNALQSEHAEPLPLLDIPDVAADAAPIRLCPLDDISAALARVIGRSAAGRDPIAAGYEIGDLYTMLLPDDFRTRRGVYYTPPALARRLLALATEAGVDWATCRVLDVACGGGAFITPVALVMADALAPCPPETLLDHLSTHVQGFEVDPFGAWLSQVLLDAALVGAYRASGRRLAPIVHICDSLDQVPKPGDLRDLVIGNPPYGRVTLSPHNRARYQRSLYGHANLYGLFMDLSVRWARPGGVIALVTPTSFLSGEYFKRLRRLLATEAPPVGIDLIADRKDVFADVLQETLLAAYRRDGQPHSASVHALIASSNTDASIEPVGVLTLPRDPEGPWLLPRAADQAVLLQRMHTMAHRLKDYGYSVSTGPLVWNRHKQQLRPAPAPNAYPLIWAEAITQDGQFRFRADKKNHEPYVAVRGSGDEWLLTRTPCVLVQRTTSKEQGRRLVAAELPHSFLAQHGVVVVENHINMVRQIVPAPAIDLSTLTVILNSDIVDKAFRCINGSVAVSASELQALPLPPPDALTPIQRLVVDGAPRAEIEEELRRLYLGI